MITLRDFTEHEIEDEIRWMTTETEWIKADTPWESIEPTDADELRKELSDIVKESLEDFVWSRKEVFVDNHHIGFVSKYPLNTSEYVETFPLGNNESERTAVGIEICESVFWNKGYGTEALKEWLKYCFKSEEKEIFLETWSGNKRMIKCAEKCGFKLCEKVSGTHMIGSEQYDSLLYRIARDL